jgi:hypothetical protein
VICQVGLVAHVGVLGTNAGVGSVSRNSKRWYIYAWYYAPCCSTYSHGCACMNARTSAGSTVNARTSSSSCVEVARWLAACGCNCVCEPMPAACRASSSSSSSAAAVLKSQGGLLHVAALVCGATAPSSLWQTRLCDAFVMWLGVLKSVCTALCFLNAVHYCSNYMTRVWNEMAP